MVINLHGEAFDPGFGWGSFGGGPALEDALHLETEVEVVLGGPVLMYDEGGQLPLAGRLRADAATYGWLSGRVSLWVGVESFVDPRGIRTW